MCTVKSFGLTDFIKSSKEKNDIRLLCKLYCGLCQLLIRFSIANISLLICNNIQICGSDHIKDCFRLFCRVYK